MSFCCIGVLKISNYFRLGPVVSNYPFLSILISLHDYIMIIFYINSIINIYYFLSRGLIFNNKIYIISAKYCKTLHQWVQDRSLSKFPIPFRSHGGLWKFRLQKRGSSKKILEKRGGLKICNVSVNV
jgi:hypothetical protein